MKIGIIGGAGTLGSNIAFYLATKNFVDEIVLIDVKENVAKAIAMDMSQAISEINHTTILSGSWDALAGCNIVVNTASLPERSVKSRLEYLESNLAIVKNVAGYIKNYCPEAVIINATNPIDIFNYILCILTGMPSKQFIGFSRNDSLRLNWSVAKVLNVSTSDVQALVVGEHGDAQVPLFSLLKVKGEPVKLTQEQKTEVNAMISTWFTKYQSLDSGRTTGFTSAIGVAHLIEAMVKNTGEILACSAILDGQYGISGVSLGIPVVLATGGIERVAEMQLSDEEIAALKKAAQKNLDILNSIKWK